MKLTEKFKRNLKIIISVFLLLVLALFIIIVVQTIQINKKTAEINNLKAQNEENVKILQQQEEEIKYFESESFKTDYEKFELESGENNVVYK